MREYSFLTSASWRISIRGTSWRNAFNALRSHIKTSQKMCYFGEDILNPKYKVIEFLDIKKGDLLSYIVEEKKTGLMSSTKCVRY